MSTCSQSPSDGCCSDTGQSLRRSHTLKTSSMYHQVRRQSATSRKGQHAPVRWRHRQQAAASATKVRGKDFRCVCFMSTCPFMIKNQTNPWSVPEARHHCYGLSSWPGQGVAKLALGDVPRSAGPSGSLQDNLAFPWHSQLCGSQCTQCCQEAGGQRLCTRVSRGGGGGRN